LFFQHFNLPLFRETGCRAWPAGNIFPGNHLYISEPTGVRPFAQWEFALKIKTGRLEAVPA